MPDNSENIIIEFASKEYIEEYIRSLSGLPIEERISFPDILRNLLPSEKSNIHRYYYDGENSLFVELANSLSSLKTSDVTEAATRDLAIEIIKFLLCFPENCQVTEETSPFFLKTISVSFSLILNTAKNILISGAGPYGEAWEDVDSASFKIAGQIFQQINIEETLQTLSHIEFTPAELHAIFQSTGDSPENPQTIYTKIRDAVTDGGPVLVYCEPEDTRNHPGVKEYRFRASRGKGRNKGRVFLKEGASDTEDFLDVPIATPTHKYNDDMIKDRLAWILDNCRKTPL